METSRPFLLVNRELVHVGKGQFFPTSFVSFTFTFHSSFDGDTFDNHLLVGRKTFLLASNIVFIKNVTFIASRGVAIPIVQES